MKSTKELTASIFWAADSAMVLAWTEGARLGLALPVEVPGARVGRRRGAVHKPALVEGLHDRLPCRDRLLGRCSFCAPLH